MTQTTTSRINLRQYLIETSTVTAAVFAVLAYTGQQSTDAVLARTEAHTARIAGIAADALELNIEQIRRWAPLVSDVGGARAGIDKLVENSDRQLKALREAQAVGSRRAAVSPEPAPARGSPTPASEPLTERREVKRAEPAARAAQRQAEVGGWSQSAPAVDVNKKAQQIFREMTFQ